MFIDRFKSLRYLILSLPIVALVAFSIDRNAISSNIPEPKVGIAVSAAMDGKQTAILAGGCFWGVEAVFEHVKGVSEVVSGYSGGDEKTANYDRVSSGKTDHAEAVKIVYDPTQISYAQLLKIYFSVAHDPTQINRQGPDKGPQYRSAIFFTNDEQRQIAASYIAQLNQSKAFSKPIATQLVSLDTFYAAEPEHQDFLVHNPRHPYIVYHDLPKIEKLRKQFPGVYQ